MAFCASCGKQLAENSSFCGGCGAQVGAAAATQPGNTAAPVPVNLGATASGLADNVAGMLAYVTIVPAIVFLAVAPYNRSRFVRFHSFQSIFLCVGWFVLWLVLSVGLGTIFGIFAHLLLSLFGLGFFVLWIILLIKAYQGQMFKVPVIGEMAEKQAGNI